jgi:hypothetical protein
MIQKLFVYAQRPRDGLAAPQATKLGNRAADYAGANRPASCGHLNMKFRREDEELFISMTSAATTSGKSGT